MRLEMKRIDRTHLSTIASPSCALIEAYFEHEKFSSLYCRRFPNDVRHSNILTLQSCQERALSHVAPLSIAHYRELAEGVETNHVETRC